MKNKFVKILVVALAVMSVIILSILPASAAYSDNLDSDFKYFIVFTNGDYIISTEPLTTYNGSGYCYFNSPGSLKLYRNDEVIISGSGKSNFYNVSSPSEIQSSNYDIYFNGELFFRPPTLLNRLLNLVPQGVGEKITGDLGILTTCGIGFLALLIGLSLFPKVLYKFL